MEDIENAFKRFTQERNDIGIVMISQTCANEIRPLIQQLTKPIPTVLEIPSKDTPYESSKDGIMLRVKQLLGKD